MTNTTLGKPANGLIGVSLAETLERVINQLAIIVALDDKCFFNSSVKDGVDSICSGAIFALQYEIEIAGTRHR